MKKISVSKYKELEEGATYIFRTFGMKGSRDRRGKLLRITTKLKEHKTPEGQIILDPPKKELVGETLIFEPEDNMMDWKGEQLRIYSTTVGCGLFQVFCE